MTDPHDNEIEFSVRVPVAQIGRLVEAMENAGLPFRAADAMIAIDRASEAVTAGVTGGDELDEAVDGLNGLLDVHGEWPKLRTDTARWTMAERWAALRVANSQMSGLGSVHQAPWWIVQNHTWHPDVTGRHPDAPWDFEG